MDMHDYTGTMHKTAQIKNAFWHKAHFVGVLNMLFQLTISNSELTC